MTLEPESFEIVVETFTRQHYPTRPRDIYIGPACLLSSFGAAEIEKEAERLVRFFQQKGYWSAFELIELNLFYQQNGWDPETALEGLAKPWFHDMDGWVDAPAPYVVRDANELYCVTTLFIERCIKAKDPTAFLRMAEGVADFITSKQTTEPPKKKVH